MKGDARCFGELILGLSSGVQLQRSASAWWPIARSTSGSCWSQVRRKMACSRMHAARSHVADQLASVRQPTVAESDEPPELEWERSLDRRGHLGAPARVAVDPER